MIFSPPFQLVGVLVITDKHNMRAKPMNKQQHLGFCIWLGLDLGMNPGVLFTVFLAPYSRNNLRAFSLSFSQFVPIVAGASSLSVSVCLA